MRLHVLWSACVSLCPEVIVHFHVLACNKGWVCIFMCLHVSEGWAWFAHIKSLTLMYFHSSSHIQSSMSVPLHVLVYVNIIKLARMKRHACVCARLHVLKLGTHLHFWEAGHVWVCMCYWGEGLAHYYQLHRSKNNSMVMSHSRALLLQQQEEAKELINVSLSLSSSLAKYLVWFSHKVTKTVLVVPCDLRKPFFQKFWKNTDTCCPTDSRSMLLP